MKTRRRGRGRNPRVVFDNPGKATAWGIIGCMLCTAFAGAGFMWAFVITLVTALIGCFNG